MTHSVTTPSQAPELQILELIEKMGNPSKDEGEWIAKIDLVESGKALKLEEQEELGKCGAECKTIQKAVEDILEEHDTDIAEKLWQVLALSASCSVCHPMARPLHTDILVYPLTIVLWIHVAADTCMCHVTFPYTLSPTSHGRPIMIVCESLDGGTADP